MNDPSQMRIGDSDRHRVAEVLREAAGEGRLDIDELDERLEATWAARTYADLVPITVHLPTVGLGMGTPAVPGARPGEALPSNPRAPRHNSSVAIMGGQDRKGIWTIGGKHTAVAVMGEVQLDLRQAILHGPETVIIANAIMGGVDITVNARTHVVVEGFGIMGEFNQARDRVDPELGATSPVVRVKGFALMGAVTVTRKAMPGESRRRWRLPR